MKVFAVTPVILGLAIALGALPGPSLAHAGAGMVQAVRRVEIDILPSRKENEIKLSEKSKSIQVVLVGEINFAVSEIDAATIEMGGARPVALKGRTVDINFDKQDDLEYRFQIGKLALDDTTKSLCLTGKLLDGQQFRGCGDVVIKP
jgi:hypothetical protein